MLANLNLFILILLLLSFLLISHFPLTLAFISSSTADCSKLCYVTSLRLRTCLRSPYIGV